jgi:hypothetical protein
MITRAPGTRTSRTDTRQRRLESLAAEFALLAQRRTRAVRQIDLLDQQREAAAAGLAKLTARMGWLAQRMNAIDPDLLDPEATSLEPEPPPPPVAVPERARKGAVAAQVPVMKPASAAAIGRQWLANRQTPPPRPARQAAHGSPGSKWGT